MMLLFWHTCVVVETPASSPNLTELSGQCPVNGKVKKGTFALGAGETALFAQILVQPK
jgi:hypothetical protein